MAKEHWQLPHGQSRIVVRQGPEASLLHPDEPSLHSLARRVLRRGKDVQSDQIALRARDALLRMVAD